MQSKKLDMRGRRASLTAPSAPIAASKAGDAAFEKKKRRDEAVSDYEKAQEAVQEKVARLRALRLARDEAERAEAERVAAKPAPKKPASKKRAPRKKN